MQVHFIEIHQVKKKIRYFSNRVVSHKTVNKDYMTKYCFFFLKNVCQSSMVQELRTCTMGCATGFIPERIYFWTVHGVHMSITMNLCNSQLTCFSKFSPYWTFSFKDFILFVNQNQLLFRDEAMIPYRYRPCIPTFRENDIHMITESITGYILNLKIYTCKVK